MSQACLDGALVDLADARIPLADPGLLRGDGVFEVVRLYGGRPFALDDHLERMAGSAEGLRLDLDLNTIRADIERLLAAERPSDAALRVLVTRGGHRACLIEELLPPRRATTLHLVTYAPPRLLDGIKSLSYAANMLALRLAQEAGADDALLVTPHGRVLEAPTAALFYVVDGRLCTPPIADHVLDSITRRRLVGLCDVEERSLPVDDLGRIEEAFLASTTREVETVQRIGEHAVDPDGPRAVEAARRLSDHVAAELGLGDPPALSGRRAR